MHANCSIEDGILYGHADCHATNLLDFQFGLTSPSILHLTVTYLQYSDGGFRISSSSDTRILLEGPGIQFDSNPLLNVEQYVYDLFFDLDPGIYDLQGVAHAEFVTGSFSDRAYLTPIVTFSTDFASVPEPRWTFLAVAMLLVAWRGLVHRYRSVQ